MKIKNSIFIENKYFGKTEMEQYNSEVLDSDQYENKKDLYFKERDDQLKIINTIQELTSEEKKLVSIEGIIGDNIVKSNNIAIEEKKKDIRRWR